jgi:hypothetical protein
MIREKFKSGLSANMFERKEGDFITGIWKFEQAFQRSSMPFLCLFL